MLKLYHYTNEAAYHAIIREGEIRSGLMNKYGKGVYLTDLDPGEHTREEVANANYGWGARHNLDKGRLDYHIPIHILSDAVQKVTDNTYLYPSDTLRLNDYSLRNADSNERWIQRSVETAMVVGKGAATMAVVAGGAVAAARLLEAADGCWRNHQDQRTHELERTLARLVRQCGRHDRYTVKRTPGSSGVYICCQWCNHERVTKDYHSGVLWADTVDPKEVDARLSEHDMLHIIYLVLKILVAVAAWMIFARYSR